MSTGNPFDAFAEAFGIGPARQANTTPAPKPKPQQEKGVQLHGHKVDGKYYVRAADVAELLEANNVLPSVAATLRKADRG